MAEEKKEQAPSKPPLNLKKLLGLVFAVINCTVVGGGAYMAYAGTLGFRTPAALEEDLNREMVEFRKTLDEPAVMYGMEPFNTNLEGLPRRFIRVELSVEMYDKEGFEELVTLGGQGRDAIMRILNAKHFEDIETVQGKLQLKNEIIAYLNDSLKRGVVKNVFFTKFQVQ